MLSGAHVIIYADDAEKARAFRRGVLGLPSVDAGRGWLISGCRPPSSRPTRSSRGMRPVQCRAAGTSACSCATTSTPGMGTLSIYQPRHPVPARPS